MNNDHINSSSVAGESKNSSHDIYSRHDLRTYLQNNPDTRPLFTHYLSRLWVKYSSLRLNVLAGPAIGDDSISLPAVYVALNTKTNIRIGREIDAALDSSVQSVAPEGSYLNQRILAELGRLAKYEKTHTRPISALEMLECNYRLVLVGPAGGGKSTFAPFMPPCMAGTVL